ncbi:TPA_inf: ORF1p [Cleome droserifolia amalgavirus 1]|uniref:ORF1p n=1 Tax=Cleome droserifolia amalgavirus 1 TaxID=2069321 RepID=UPI000DC1C9EB|nr:ORF1p [Cleome droserifolia amalgavirus 1]DAB41678.1 TPA_inf: ORF1p [Cleome droserifolia amalgavirus 1]
MAEHQDPQAQGGAVGGDVEEVNLLEGIGGIPTAAEERNRLQEALRPLIANGVNIERITVNDCLRLGFTVEQLARAIRVLTSIASDEMRDLIFSQAHLSRLAPAARSVTLDHILAICEWMKTERGAQAIRNLQTSAKQERRAVGGRTVADVSMLQAFNQQVADWSAQVKEARKEIEEEMAELRAQLALKQQELNDSLAAINESYWPASSYKAPALNVVQSQAYALYAADCRRSGTVPLPAGSLGYSKAVELFGQQVREDHQLQYLRAEEARDTLSEYLQRLVGLKAGQGRRREVENFRAILAGMGVAAADAVPARAEEVAIEQVGGGEDQPAGERAPDQAPEGGDAGGADEGEAAGGHQTPPRPAAEDRRGGRRVTRRRDDGAGPSTRRVGPRAAPYHTRRAG